MVKTKGIRDILRPKGKVDLRCSVETLGLWKKRNEVEAKWSESCEEEVVSMINATFVGTLKRDIRVFGIKGWVGKSWSSNKNVPCWHTIILP
ncbi:hypothetical protein HZH68_005165 [Vespula germanica]|uniref:Uncharacterized protein n=1 Tax=Vespula germanica TaxID=30212 RepID=A0A834KKM6_VESGE|nr:hypothetical protein HZH68_005165 [Vespula germanica]